MSVSCYTSSQSFDTETLSSEQADPAVAGLFHAQDSSGDGMLDRAEVCELLSVLRHRAINGASDVEGGKSLSLSSALSLSLSLSPTLTLTLSLTL